MADKTSPAETVSSERLLSCDLAARMEAEAEQFGQCAFHHGKAWNRSAESVALRAQEILIRFAAEVKQDNRPN